MSIGNIIELMPFRTEGLIAETADLPEDEFSINKAERSFPNDAGARRFFQGLKVRLLDLSEWNKNSGLSTYELFDSSGKPTVEQKLRIGAFLRITLHGSGKSDWVEVKDIFDSDDELLITVSPTYDPTGEPQ